MRTGKDAPPGGGTHFGKEQVKFARQARLACEGARAGVPVMSIREEVGAQERVGQEGLQDDAHVTTAGGGRVGGGCFGRVSW